MNEPIIDIDDFGVKYPHTIALEHISTQIKEHAITAIIGPSGCGKSTLLSSINRLTELDATAQLIGTISYRGSDITTIHPEELRHRIGMVFQTPTPFPLSIYKNLTYAPRYYGNPPKHELDTIVKEALTTTGLYDEVRDNLNTSALKLSGGQQQRLCIARALTAQPDVLLLDEPCSSLDVKNTKIIEDLLLSLKERYTIVIVTHNLFQARRIADEVIFLLNGHLIEQGSVETVFEHPRQPETQEYLHGTFS